ncbi:thiamine phosphate synthase [Niabella ginsengisoli]|uniref:Thiamine phosphate synthase n=1 Tax=Niabella ginsengisoli TaxID=522298 RepID=A0ABS9SE13_9BACT|nr:thiamine phosphate synthase [Niabella ginsengisoli]
MASEKIVAIQIWDHFKQEQCPLTLINEVCEISHSFSIPVFINNKWELFKTTKLDGVHFDEIPEDLELIKKQIDRNFLWGLTCNNDLTTVRWAADNNADYISFCSMFPSLSANSCELVVFDTIKEAKTIFKKPVFLAGGITPENIRELKELDFTGVAVISGIMKSDDPVTAVEAYYNNL